MFWYDINYTLVDGGGYLIFLVQTRFFFLISNILIGERMKFEPA
jgi:hypothetical protein